MNGRDDYCHILAGESRINRDGFRLVRPMAYALDNETQVAMNPEAAEEVDPEGCGVPEVERGDWECEELE